MRLVPALLLSLVVVSLALFALINLLGWARAGGAVVLVGVKLSPLRLDLNPIWYQEVDLSGVWGHGVEIWQGETRHTFDIVIELMRKKKLTIDGLITQRFPLSQWRQGVNAALDKGKGTIRIVLDYSLE